MNEQMLIQQLEALREIKPNKHWVVLTKKNILDQEKSVPSWLFIPLGRPAFALSALSLVAVVVFGAVVFFQPQAMPQMAYGNLSGFISKLMTQNKANETAIASLNEIQNKLEEINAGLANLKTMKDQNQALTMTEVVRATAKRGGEAVEDIKQTNSGLSSRVLASLSQVEEMSRSLEQKTTAMQAEMLEAYLTALRGQGLTGKDAENLAKAEQYYKQGKTAEAMIFVLKIGD